MSRYLATAAVLTAISTFTFVPGARAAEQCGVLYDDFHYTSSSDSAFTGNGWAARSGTGSPGVPGATWQPGNITFPTVDGQQVAQLVASTDGTAGGTAHAEMYQAQQRFREGTYASRVRFSDAPDSGADGDHINETYFTISPLRYDRDPDYSELDFSEYLPNGGWGGSQANYQTSWHTYWNSPTWGGQRISTAQQRSFDGWHDLVTQVAGGHVKYYVDGQLTADHTVDADGNSVYPRTAMSINYNMWFIDTAGHSGGPSVYKEQIAWTYYAGNEVVSPADATARADQYRSSGTHHVDTVRGCALTRSGR
ncbi:glycoside hydrolase family 16 protein [Amycolatopsis jejuensis]|uniref:glycoside hydrolase family 16 protein n=1 Tax=Amycolatopsis jejuensis TaxID=330084 RepID=UPI000526A2B3|nr:glycoside hydrolase family 16 protein [Amycolatopsis jejuensis]